MGGNTDSAVGLNVRRARRYQGLTLEQLAGRVGRSKGWLSMIENGRLTLEKLGDVAAIAAALEIPADTLLNSPFSLGPDIEHGPVPFPAAPDTATVARYNQFARNYLVMAASGDLQAAATWLRRVARDPDINPWLLTEQIGVIVAESHTRRPLPHPARPPDARRREGSSAARVG